MIKEIEVDGVRHSIQAENTIKTTWAELKSLRDNSQLAPGTFYRITDYVTTTTQSETKSANHPFDVIVLALSENTLCEDAKAILHEGDTYFADSDLSAWELKYCLDNDKTRFWWADEKNGKGVIYRMIDEKRNNCPYDFKNILFYNTNLESPTTINSYYYTFSYVFRGVLYDGTTEKEVTSCYDNVMGEYSVSKRLYLNKNVFRNDNFLNLCYSNIFGNNCYSNTFGHDCRVNTFGSYCNSNIFGNEFFYNTFGDFCSYNIFGDHCSYRKLEGGSEKTLIPLSEEFYDDGSGQVVPVKHPDLSTQPSILPYKFMGQYVYERLVPISESLEKYANKLVLSAEAVGKGCCKTVMIEDGVIAEDISTYRWVKIVYTSMPEEGSYYYQNESVSFDQYAELYGESNFIIYQGVPFTEPPALYNGNTNVYPHTTNDIGVFAFMLTEDYFSGYSSVGINFNVDTKCYVDIYKLNELINTWEVDRDSNYIQLDRSEYRDAILTKQLRMIVRG